MKSLIPVKYTLAFVFVLLSIAVQAQSGIVFKSVSFPPDSYIPMAEGTNRQVAERINDQIKSTFDIESFDIDQVDEFRWSSLTYELTQLGNVVGISYSGEYISNTLYMINSQMFFDTTTGDELEEVDIPFHALFTLETYFPFVEKYWLSGVNKEFEAVSECAEHDVDPYCSLYGVLYDIKESDVLLELDNEDCLPRVLQACTPMYSTKVPLSVLTEYLSDFGKKVLLEDGYVSKNVTEKLIYGKRHLDRMPNHLFVTGKINGKYPFKMSLDMRGDGSVSGHYYYDSKKVNIVLSGEMVDGQIELKEKSNGTVTGKFSLLISEDYSSDGVRFNGKYLSGKWKTPDSSKVYPVVFEEVISNKLKRL